MRVDSHTHLWSAKTVPPHLRTYAEARGPGASVESSATSLLASMDRVGLDAAVAVALVFTPDATDDEVAGINAYVRSEAERSSGRVAWFCAVNPRSRDALAILRDELAAGARGFKFHGAFQELAVDDRILYPLYEELAVAGRPVLFHAGDIGILPLKDKHTRATLFDAVACDFPGLPIVLGHAGRTDWSTVAGLLRKHRTVYAEVSSVIGRDAATAIDPLRRLLEAVKGWAGNVDQIMFGSDYPLYSQSATFANLDALHAALPSLDTILRPDDLLAVRNANAGAFARAYELFSSNT